MFPIWSSEFTEIVSTRPNLYNCTSIMTGGIVEAIQPLVMKGRTDCDPFMRYSISDLTTVYGGMFGGGSRPFGRYWYLTDSKPLIPTCFCQQTGGGQKTLQVPGLITARLSA